MTQASPSTPPAPSVFEAGPPDSWGEFRLEMEGLPPVPKQFLSEVLGLTGMEVSLNIMPPGTGMPFVHRHHDHEEVYLFLDGTGEFQHNDERIPIHPGTCVRCAPSVRRCWRNTGKIPMPFVCLQAKHGSLEKRLTEDGELVPEPPLWQK